MTDSRFTDQYVRHVAGQMTEFELRSAGGARQVVLASQDRRGDGEHSAPLAVLVLAPSEGEPRYRVSDNGYIAGIVGVGALATDSVVDLLVWHVVEADPATGHLLAPVDDPSQVGARIHDLEQAMTDLLRHAAHPDDAEHGLSRLTRDRSGRAPGFRSDCQQVVDHLHHRLPGLTWSVVMVDAAGVMSPLVISGDSYPQLAEVAVPWEDTVCAAQAKGLGPTAAPNLMDVPAYAAMPVTRLGFEGCYIGATLRAWDGTVVGALCGLAPEPQPVEEIAGQAETVELLGLALSRTWDTYQLLAETGRL